jgi:hypothetical protein
MIPLTVFLHTPDTLRVAFRYDADTVAAVEADRRRHLGQGGQVLDVARRPAGQADKTVWR